MTSLVVDVWHPGHLHTVAGLLLIHVLESVLVEVDRLRSVALWCCLLVGIDQLIVNPLEPSSDLLCGQQFVYCASIVGGSEL